MGRQFPFLHGSHHYFMILCTNPLYEFMYFLGIVEEDLEMFYGKWSKYDPHATQFITFNQEHNSIINYIIRRGE